MSLIDLGEIIFWKPAISHSSIFFAERPIITEFLPIYVLSNFSSDEKIVLDDFLKGGGEAIECFMNEGFQKAAKTFSKKSYTEV